MLRTAERALIGRVLNAAAGLGLVRVAAGCDKLDAPSEIRLEVPSVVAAQDYEIPRPYGSKPWPNR